MRIMSNDVTCSTHRQYHEGRSSRSKAFLDVYRGSRSMNRISSVLL